MKFFILLLLLVLEAGIFIPSARASKARMDSLGGENVAFYYFNDTRNVFFNPAYVNINKDFLIYEWGKDIEGAAPSDANPKPEGGFFKSSGNFIYGIYLGHEEGYEGRDNVGVSTPPTFLYQDNPLELFIAGDAGVEWGAAIKFSKNQDEQTGINRKQSSLKLNLGAIVGNLEGKLAIDIFDKSEGGSTPLEEYKSDLGYGLGVNYFLNDITLYGKLNKAGYEYKRSADGIKDIEKDDLTWEVGGGQSIQLNEKAKMYFDVHYTNSSTDRTKNMATTAQKEETKYYRIPLTLGLETPVRDWLVVRGSISQYILSEETDVARKDTSSKKTTSVAAGATLDFGKLKIDGLVGTTDSTGTSNKTGVLSLSNLLTKVSLLYWF